jgi:two-component system chemotaxis sensor kinase CheA
MHDLLADFATEAQAALAETRAALARGDAGRLVALRRLHGLKGSAACANLAAVASAIHEAETGLAEGHDIGPILERIARLAAEVYGPAAVRGDPTLGAAFAGLESMTRDLGRRLGKRIELMAWGADTPLDPAAAPALRQALIALIRNACDHGVETAAERAAKGKPAVALVRLVASRDGEETVIEVSDDGRGFAPELARQSAAPDQAPDFGPGLGALDAQRLMFEAGFSTAFTVTDLSGRGMGLDLVRDVAESLGGRVETASVPDRGASFTLRLPAGGERQGRLRGAA